MYLEIHMHIFITFYYSQVKCQTIMFDKFAERLFSVSIFFELTVSR